MCSDEWDGPKSGGNPIEDFIDPDIIRPSKHPPDQGVVHLTDKRPVQSGRILADLRAYWDSLRQGRAAPMRSNIEPHGIREALDYAFILERLSPGNARFRLAGRHLIDLMGMEVRGMPLSALFNPPSRLDLVGILETVFSAPQIAELDLQDEAQRNKPLLTAKMLLLPLRSDLGDVSRALGCIIAEGRIGATPRRFDIAGFQLSPVIAGAQIKVPAAFDTSHQGFSEAPTAWKPVPPAVFDPAIQPTESPAPASPTLSAAERRAGFRLIACSKTPYLPPSPQGNSGA